jgi:hypothetical protein
MSKELCRSCREIRELRVCIECGVKECCEDCTEGWIGDICTRCQQDNPVFFDVHSHAAGGVDKKDGATR